MSEQNICNGGGSPSEHAGAWDAANITGTCIQRLDRHILFDLPAAAATGTASPRQRVISALQAATQLLEFIASDRDTSRQASRLLATINASLQDMTAELEGLEHHKPLGPIVSTLSRRKSNNNHSLVQYARMVIAVEWLQKLRDAPLRPGQAMAIVARAICGSESEIDAWMARFQRPSSRRRQETVYRMWRELEESYRQSGRNMADASLETIFLWMKEENPPALYASEAVPGEGRGSCNRSP